MDTRMLSSYLLEDRNSHNRVNLPLGVLGYTKSVVVVPFVLFVPVPVRRPHVLRFVVPGATTKNPFMAYPLKK